MKVTIDQIEAGISNYLDKEMLSQYPADGIEKLLIGAAISLVIRNKKKDIQQMLESDSGKNLGIMDDSKMVDLDLVKTVLKDRIPDTGVHYEGKLVGGLTFRKDDVDKLYEYIIGTRN